MTIPFDLEKTSLRNWSYRRALDQPAAPAERAAILDRMQFQIDGIADKAEQAATLDRQRGKVLAEHAERLSLLDFLDDVVGKLDRETAVLLDEGPLEVPQLSVIDAEFDQLRGIALADALEIALSTEAAALDRERDRADQGFSAARSLFLSAGGFGLIATLVMALALSRRLRQPLRELDKGLNAYTQGDFSYRFDSFRDSEFVGLGQHLNAMATEVELARTRAVQDRVALEETVAARTVELRRTLDELAASEGARQKLLADIGHELRTPVTVIRGEAQVALRLRDKDDRPYRAALGRIVDVSRQMGHLIEDLLVLVRDPKALPVISLRPVGLGDVVQSALDVARTIAAQRQVGLQGPGPLPEITVQADPDRLRQVLVCLLDNALRYSHPEGVVTLTVTEGDKDWVLVEIADHGIGIAAADLPRVFDRGWRSTAARNHRPDGLGLGLAIARQLTEAQGSRLALRPGPQGKGIVAALCVPIKGNPQIEEVAWTSC